jgi:hypothetical protein
MKTYVFFLMGKNLKEFVTPLEVLDLNIPLRDKIWVLLRPEILGDQFMLPVNNAVSRARKCVDSLCPIDVVNTSAYVTRVAATARASVRIASVRAIFADVDEEMNASAVASAYASASYAKYMDAAAAAHCASVRRDAVRAVAVHAYAAAAAAASAISKVAYVHASDECTATAAFFAELEAQLDDIKVILKERE